MANRLYSKAIMNIFIFFQIEAFCKKYPEAGASEAARKGAVETVKRNIAWLERNEKVIGDWLKKFHRESKEI